MEQKLKDAAETLVAALSEDKTEGSYYYSWQANIAMAFKDEFDRYSKDKEMEGTAKNFNIHEIANNAAKNFLDTLCHKPDPAQP